MNPTYYIAYTKWMNEFLHKWDYTILGAVVFLLASVGLGALCYLYDYWLFKEIWDE
jgi:hypothetical protein